MSQEKLPVSDFYTVLDQEVIFKTPKWLEAVVIVESFGKRSITIYMWMFDSKTNKWKRKQKLSLRNRADWEKIKSAVDRMFGKL